MMINFNTVPEKSALLLVGPPLSAKDSVIYSVVSKALSRGDCVIYITTDHFPKDIESFLKKYKIDSSKYEKTGSLKFIDCYSAQAQENLSDTSTIKTVPGPLALNEISVALSEFENVFYKKNRRQLVIFQSLSTLLIYSLPEAIQRFVQVIVARTKKANGSILFTLEEGMHDSKVFVGFEHLMDGIITVSGKKSVLKKI